jgi:hypothetical protein
MHLNGDYPLNLPYFLLKILTKMSKRVQSLSSNAKSNLFHQVLIKTLVVSTLREIQKPWSWLMQSLNPNPQSSKQKKGKRNVTQKQNISIDETPIKEEMPDVRVTRNSRGKRPNLDLEIEMFSEEDVKGEEDSDEYFDIQTTTKHELPSTSKKGATVKRTKNKGVPLSQNPRRNSTRVTNKYRLKSKAMFNPSIKEENVIVIEDHSEDVEAGTRKKENRPPLHKKPAKRGK